MILPILHYPDKRLRTVAKAVEVVNEAIKTQIDNMFETMYDSNGIGLAATQVNFHQRIIVIDVSEEKDSPIYLINPKIIAKSGDILFSEGCLSVPEYYENIKRANKIKVQYLDINNKELELEADDILSVCIQHEIDHLNGILFIDYISKLKQKRLREKINKRYKIL